MSDLIMGVSLFTKPESGGGGGGEYLFDLTHEWLMNPAASGEEGMVRDISFWGPSQFILAGGITDGWYTPSGSDVEHTGTYVSSTIGSSGAWSMLAWKFDSSGALSGDGVKYLVNDGSTHFRSYWGQVVNGKIHTGGRSGDGLPTTGEPYDTWTGGKSSTALYGQQGSAGVVLDLADGSLDVAHWANDGTASDLQRDGIVLPDGRHLRALSRAPDATNQTWLKMFSADYSTELAEFDMGDIANTVGSAPAMIVNGDKLYVTQNTSSAPTTTGAATGGFNTTAPGSGSFMVIWRFDISGNSFVPEYYTYLAGGPYVANETHGLAILGNGNIAFCGGNGYSASSAPTTAGALYEDHPAASSSGSAGILAIMSPTLETLHYCTLFRGNTTNEQTYFDGGFYDAARRLMWTSGASDSPTLPTTDGSDPGGDWAAYIVAFRFNDDFTGLDASDPIAWCQYLAESNIVSGRRSEVRRLKIRGDEMVFGGVLAESARVTSGALGAPWAGRQIITAVPQPFQRASGDDGSFASPDDLADLGVTNQLTVRMKATITTATTLFDLAEPSAGLLKAFVQADGAIRLTMGAGGASDNMLTAAGTIVSGTLHEVMIVFDGANDEQHVYLDGAKVAAASGTENPGTYTFPSTGLPIMLDGTGEIEQLHYIEIYDTCELSATGSSTYRVPRGAPVKRILGPAGAASADAWKAGSDAFVPYVAPPPAPPVTAPTTQTAIIDGISSADPTSVTITIPATVSTGDWLLIGAVHRKDGTLQCSIGTQVGSQASDYANHEMAVWKYQVTGGDTPGTTTFTVSSTSTFTNFSVCVVPVTGSDGVDDEAGPGVYGVFGNTATAPSVTTTRNNSRAYCFVSGVTGNTYTPQAGAVEVAEATTGTAGLYVFSYLQETAGATGTLTATIDSAGTANHYGCSIAMKGT